MITTLLTVLLLVASPATSTPATSAPATVTSDSAAPVAVDVEPLCI
jgi:hypothetical protein